MSILSAFGRINAPQELNRFGAVESGGIANLLNLIFNILIVVAGIFTLFNFVMAGYGFLSAGDDPKKIQDAQKKIVNSIIGLAIVAGSFLIAALVGIFMFGSATAILRPVIKAP